MQPLDNPFGTRLSPVLRYVPLPMSRVGHLKIGAQSHQAAARIAPSTIPAAGVRVFYDTSGTTVEVLAIAPKSEAEPWLAQFGNSE